MFSLVDLYSSVISEIQGLKWYISVYYLWILVCNVIKLYTDVLFWSINWANAIFSTVPECHPGIVCYLYDLQCALFLICVITGVVCQQGWNLVNAMHTLSYKPTTIEETEDHVWLHCSLEVNSWTTLSKPRDWSEENPFVIDHRGRESFTLHTFSSIISNWTLITIWRRPWLSNFQQLI